MVPWPNAFRGGALVGNLGENFGRPQRVSVFSLRTFVATPTTSTECPAFPELCCPKSHTTSPTACANREPIFIEDFDRHVYLDLVAKQAKRFQVPLFGHRLMSNHVHWIAVPEEVDSLAKAFGEAHGRYAQYANARLGRRGHFWQDRFFSCGLDAGHRWVALRYVERNPVRARLVESADQWPWSSAAVHVGQQRVPSWMSVEEWAKWFTPAEWQVWLEADGLAEAEQRLRSGTAIGRPVGDEGFVLEAETALGRRLHPEKGCRPRKEGIVSKAATATSGQQVLWAGS
ncbi:MAG: transposase [Bryobacteraceae bacterium]